MNFVLILTLLISVCNSTVIDLTSNNFQTVLNSNELVLVDFYASWCYFSNILDPIFTEASNLIETEFKDIGKVALGKVDCEKQTDLSKQYGIRKYPTIKLFRYGEVNKREYRGARSGPAFVEFIRSQLVDPIIYPKPNEVITRELGKSYIIGHFKEKSGPNYEQFRRISHQLSEDCKFVVKLTPDLTAEKFVHEGEESSGMELTKFDDQEAVKNWAIKLCTPIVRNITFQNAEDITEEGLPLILLFYNPDSPEIAMQYSKFVADYLMPEKKTVNFVYADGKKFAHPLTHLGKAEKDLPIIAIDSFQHMFLLTEDINLSLKDPAILRRYVNDLHSGKLHREFHNGPDPVPQILNQIASEQVVNRNSLDQETTPIPSIFKKLKPNSNRYTIFHDEF